MYQYDDYDRALVLERVAQFRDQVQRFMAGALSEEEFLPLRLQNGLYLQKHAYMLRVAIPYGTLSARQMRTLASIARDYDRGYGHFTTRQNLQFNWIELAQVPDILQRLAEVEMHAIQTSGNCVRNITTEAFAGVAADELIDPRPLAEILRQWSTINPEFLFLPRKFKIAICSAEEDRAAIMMHDIGLYLYLDESGQMLLRVIVGGHPGESLGGDVAHAVAGGLDGVHVDGGQAFEDVRHLGQFDPVELHVLARGEVAVATVEIPGDAGQGTQLRRAQGAVGDRHAQHVGVLLQVQAVLQAQGQELFFAQLAGRKTPDLVAKLRHPLQHQGPVVIVVLVHVATSSISTGRALSAGFTGLPLWPSSSVA